ncbi:MAG: sugar kinase [Planctomyces sp.]|nr:sugar kinase [Planctomyces sp.]
MGVIVTFGEIMARLAPAGFLRLQQVLPGTIDVTYAGAEANVAASLAILGAKSRFVSALPHSPLADGCVTWMQGLGIETSYVIRPETGRMGIYYVETGANQRPSRVVYDRDHTAISQSQPGDFRWSEIFQNADWLHITSITAALSKSAANVTLEAARQARKAGVRVSCDINFRSKLWRWEPGVEPFQLASRFVQELIPYVSLLTANSEDCRLMNVELPNADGHDREPEYLKQMAKRIVERFPDIQLVATTLRENISASHNNWGASLYDAASDNLVFAPMLNGRYEPYEIRNMIDRVGGGDAFSAGLLYAFSQPELSDHQTALEFATAASCLSHSIIGDVNYSTRSEIEDLMRGQRSGRVVR